MKRNAAVILTSLLIFVSGVASAQPGGRWRDVPEDHPAMERHREPRGMSMGDAIDMVQRRTGGRVLLAQPVDLDGQPGYRIKVLSRRGEVQVFYINARNGRME